MAQQLYSKWWKRIPMLQALLPLIIGIAIADIYALNWIVSMALGFIAIFLYIIFFYLPSYQRYRYAYIQGICMTFVFVAIGMCLSWIANDPLHSNWIGKMDVKDAKVLVEIKQPFIEKDQSYKTVATITQVYKNGHWRRIYANVLLYVKKDSLPLDMSYGSVCVLPAHIQEIPKVMNPGGFDFSAYMSKQHVWLQMHVLKKECQILKIQKGNIFMRSVYRIQYWILQQIHLYIKGNDERAMAETLLIGYRNNLDPMLVKAYSYTGVVHIISISGMHIGMIVAVLYYLCNMIGFFEKRSWLTLLVILITIWFFTFIAGAVPCLLRSTWMYSFIAIGKAIRRKTFVYNSIAASAFFILCLDPFSLWDIGFQLSYAAVIGIIFFLPLFQSLYLPKQPVARKLVILSFVSISAQMITTPFVLYYFHQVSIVFLIANLLVVPLSGIVLFGEIFMLSFAWFPFLEKSIGWITTMMIWMMNEIVKQLNCLPFAAWHGWSIHVIELVLLNITIVLLGIAWIYKHIRTWVFASSCLLIVLCAHVIIDMKYMYQNKCVVYATSHHVYIELIKGKQSILIGDSLLWQPHQEIWSHVFDPSYTFFHLKRRSLLAFDSIENKIWSWGQKRYLILSSNRYIDTFYELDCLILTKNVRQPLSTLFTMLHPKKIIVDATIPYYVQHQWQQEVMLHKDMNCIFIQKQGSWEEQNIDNDM